MINRLIIDGKDLYDFGCLVSGGGTYIAPKRDVTTKEVPGRNGSILIDNGRWKDVEIPYTLLIEGRENIDGCRAYLMSVAGKEVRIEDTFHPEEYRLGWLTSSIEPDMKRMLNAATVDITFTCRPQRYLKIGEVEVTSIDGNHCKLQNPTLYSSYPIICFQGSILAQGWYQINGVPVFQCSSEDYREVDCETMHAVDADGKAVSDVTFYSDERPTFSPGAITVRNAGGNLWILPRWYTL